VPIGCAVEYEGDFKTGFTVTNTYTATGELNIETTINPTKSLAGRALTAGEFTFELRQGGAVLQSAANDAEGNILFTPLVYTEEDIGQTYSYTIVEIAGIEADMAYSTMAIDFTVLVEDAGDGVLSLTVSAPADVTFFNIYTPPAPAPVPDPVPVPNFDLGAVSGNVADCLE
jgi:pilin isopeptide linkage protein